MNGAKIKVEKEDFFSRPSFFSSVLYCFFSFSSFFLSFSSFFLSFSFFVLTLHSFSSYVLSLFILVFFYIKNSVKIMMWYLYCFRRVANGAKKEKEKEIVKERKKEERKGESSCCFFPVGGICLLPELCTPCPQRIFSFFLSFFLFLSFFFLCSILSHIIILPFQVVGISR